MYHFSSLSLNIVPKLSRKPSVYLDGSIWASSIGKTSDKVDGNIGYFRVVNSAIALPKVRNAQSFDQRYP